MSFSIFFDAYIECALWSSMDESDESGGEPLDSNYGPDDFDDASLAALEREAREFYEAHEETLGEDPAHAGHDFWLSRNGHGAGYWDGDWGDDGDRLHAATKPYGGVDLYVGDDGRIHAM